MKVDDIIVGIMRLGRGSLTAKFDVQNAYHIVPVQTEDRQLLGMKWRATFYVNNYGPAFRCQVSSIYLHMYSRFSGVGGQANHHVTFLMHYLDDYVM